MALIDTLLIIVSVSSHPCLISSIVTSDGRLGQYGAEPFEWQQFGTAGVEGVKDIFSF